MTGPRTDVDSTLITTRTSKKPAKTSLINVNNRLYETKNPRNYARTSKKTAKLTLYEQKTREMSLVRAEIVERSVSMLAAPQSIFLSFSFDG